jgi:hypothetical protein
LYEYKDVEVAIVGKPGANSNWASNDLEEFNGRVE